MTELNLTEYTSIKKNFFLKNQLTSVEKCLYMDSHCSEIMSGKKVRVDNNIKTRNT